MNQRREGRQPAYGRIPRPTNAPTRRFRSSFATFP
jgi:hypothetical protein